MTITNICDTIFRLFLYADNTKMIHYSIDSNHGHELADEIRDTILDFVDELAEETFGYYGKPSFHNMSLQQNISVEDDLGKLCQRCIDVVAPMRREFNNNEKLAGIVSLIDDFTGKMGQMVFKGNFDKVTSYKLKK